MAQNYYIGFLLLTLLWSERAKMKYKRGKTDYLLDIEKWNRIAKFNSSKSLNLYFQTMLFSLFHANWKRWNLNFGT